MLDQIVIVQGQGLQEIVVSRGHDGIQLIVNIIYIMQFPDRANDLKLAIQRTVQQALGQNDWIKLTLRSALKNEVAHHAGVGTTTACVVSSDIERSPASELGISSLHQGQG
jgi:hypothetical protein